MENKARRTTSTSALTTFSSTRSAVPLLTFTSESRLIKDWTRWNTSSTWPAMVKMYVSKASNANGLTFGRRTAFLQAFTSILECIAAIASRTFTYKDRENSPDTDSRLMPLPHLGQKLHHCNYWRQRGLERHKRWLRALSNCSNKGSGEVQPRMLPCLNVRKTYLLVLASYRNFVPKAWAAALLLTCVRSGPAFLPVGTISQLPFASCRLSTYTARPRAPVLGRTLQQNEAGSHNGFVVTFGKLPFHENLRHQA